MTAALVVTENGTASTTSLIVAEGTKNEHRAVLQLIRNNLADFEEFGRVAFQMQPFDTAGGVQAREIAVLNEEHATLLLTYMRNNDVVREFKKRLVRAFYELRNNSPALTEDEIVHQALAITARRVDELTQRVAELEPQAEVAAKLLDAEGDLSVADAAQTLTRAGIKTGQGRLFAALEQRGWIYRAKGDGRWRVMQSAIDAGWMSVIPQSHYHPKTGILVLDPPQPRVTPKGLQRLLADYGAGAA